MAFLGKQEAENIDADLKNFIASKLMDGFRNRKTQEVVKVDSVLVDYKINEDKSDRDNIYIGPVGALARVWVNVKNSDGQTNDQIQLRINATHFAYNNDLKKYEIVDGEKLEMIDMS